MLRNFQANQVVIILNTPPPFALFGLVSVNTYHVWFYDWSVEILVSESDNSPLVLLYVFGQIRGFHLNCSIFLFIKEYLFSIHKNLLKLVPETAVDIYYS